MEGGDLLKVTTLKWQDCNNNCPGWEEVVPFCSVPHYRPRSVEQEQAFQVSQEQYMGENLRAWHSGQREIPMLAESIIQNNQAHLFFSVLVQ